jgi:hypothetical protein
MIEPRAVVVWSYMARDDDQKPYKRTICFRNGSTVYHGGWMGGSDSVWIVPNTLDIAERDLTKMEAGK